MAKTWAKSINSTIKDQREKLHQYKLQGSKWVVLAKSVFAILLDVFHLSWGFWFAFTEPLWRLVFPAQPKDLSHDVILITGAGNGMGREMSLYLGTTSPNSIQVLWDINAQQLDNVLEELTSRGVAAHGYLVDVSDREKVNAAAEQVRREVGHVTMIINNAGIMPASDYFWNMNAKLMEKCYSVNVLSHYWILQAFLPAMMSRNQGHIVAMASAAALTANACSAVYTGSKFAVRGFMDTLRLDFRSSKVNIKLTTVYPTMVNTNLLGEVELIGKYPSPIAQIEPQVAAQRIIEGVRRNVEHVYIPDQRVWWLIGFLSSVLPQKAFSTLTDVMDNHLYRKSDRVEVEPPAAALQQNGRANGTAQKKPSNKKTQQVPRNALQGDAASVEKFDAAAVVPENKEAVDVEEEESGDEDLKKAVLRRNTEKNGKKDFVVSNNKLNRIKGNQ